MDGRIYSEGGVMMYCRSGGEGLCLPDGIGRQLVAGIVGIKAGRSCSSAGQKIGAWGVWSLGEIGYCGFARWFLCISAPQFCPAAPVFPLDCSMNTTRFLLYCMLEVLSQNLIRQSKKCVRSYCASYEGWVINCG